MHVQDELDGGYRNRIQHSVRKHQKAYSNMSKVYLIALAAVTATLSIFVLAAIIYCESLTGTTTGAAVRQALELHRFLDRFSKHHHKHVQGQEGQHGR